MRIAYSGMFLGEGLRGLGHEVVPLPLRQDSAFDDLVAAACPAPDLVLLELWGKAALPPRMHESRCRIAAYCIDTPLNEFWMRHLLNLCDDVFVDQRSSVASLASYGVAASWLPLCAFEDDFVPQRQKEHFLTFVGRTTAYRGKRQNLLRLLQKHFPLVVKESVTRREMQELFARSQIVLNENLFSGLTLRVFQALASGSVLLTEAGGDGVDAHFSDGEHLVAFDAENILDILADMRRGMSRYEEIARRGRQRCREAHTSLARAGEFLARIAKGPGNPRRGDARRRIAAANAGYFHAVRHGGLFTDAVHILAEAVAAGDAGAPEAAHTLGSIRARRGDADAARPLLALAAGLPGTEGFVAAAKLALTFLYAGDAAEAARIVRAALPLLPEAARAGAVPDPAREARPQQALYLFLAGALLSAGRVFDLGFLKPGLERYPDSAFEYARLAWEEARTDRVLDMVIACAAASGTEAEIMDTLKEAIAAGIATDRQILYAAELARRLYDVDTAMAVAMAFRRSMALRAGG
jgi:hypothetical protein